MLKYTFIKEQNECGNIEGCKFVGDIFRTNDDDVAERLRNSATFGKTVKEIDEDYQPEEETLEDETPEEEEPLDEESTQYETMSTANLVKLCKKRDLQPTGRREALIVRLCGWDNEHQ